MNSEMTGQYLQYELDKRKKSRLGPRNTETAAHFSAPIYLHFFQNPVTLRHIVFVALLINVRGSQDSVVGRATGNELDDRGFGVLVSVR
jgi:hypothetical protein